MLRLSFSFDWAVIMFARLSIHFSLSLISFVSLIATQSLADNLFTDWTTSDLNDATPNNINNDQLLAFNNEPSSNMFTSDSLTTNPLNQAPTEPSLDTSNMFPDSTSLDSLDTITLDSSVSNDQPALLNLPNDPLGVDAMSPDLLADNVSGACSLPSSSSRRSRKRQSTEAVCSDSSYGASGEIEAAKKGFFEKTTEAKNEAYKRIVCPSAHYGAAVTIPVCSSPDPLKNAWMGALSPIYPHSETLADSKLCQLSFLVHFCLIMVDWSIFIHL